MAASQNQLLKQMCSPVRNMTASVNEIAAMSLPNAHMSTHLCGMRKLRQILSAIFISTNKPTGPTRNKASPEFEAFVKEFTLLLTALTPQLHRLGSRLSIVATSIGTVEEEGFWELWLFLTAGCAAFGAFVEDFPVLLFLHQQPYYTNLYASIHDMLQCVLSLSHSHAWMAMKRQNGLSYRTNEMLAILGPPLRCLHYISRAASNPIMFSHLSCIPSTLVPLLSCIVAEQYTCHMPSIWSAQQPATGWRATSHKGSDLIFLAIHRHDLFSFMTNVVNNFLSIRQRTAPHTTLSFLTAPAVFQVLKSIVIINHNLSSAADMVRCCLECLLALYGLAEPSSIGSPVPVLSVSELTSNRDELGLPLHNIPRLSMHVLETDVWLLHTLSAHMAVDDPLARLCYSIQASMLRDWMMSGRPYPVASAALTLMMKSVGGIAKQCSALGLLIMHHNQQNKLCKLQQGVARSSEQQQSNKQRQISPGKLSSNILAVPDLEATQHLRTLMNFVSNFKVNLPGNKFQATSGMC